MWCDAERFPFMNVGAVVDALRALFSVKKRGGLRKGGKTGHLRSEDDYPNFKGRMMEAP
jgi:hypothetical protein